MGKADVCEKLIGISEDYYPKYSNGDRAKIGDLTLIRQEFSHTLRW